MTPKQKPKDRDVYNATEPWVREQLMDTERQIEKSINALIVFHSERFDKQDQKFDEKFEAQNKWLMGLFITLIVALFALIGTMITKL